MKYIVFLIYIIVAAQWINSNPKGNAATQRGHDFYKTSGVLNLMIGSLGLTAINLFLRGKDIIPDTFVWIAIVGFIFTEIYAMYCIYKAMTTIE